MGDQLGGLWGTQGEREGLQPNFYVVFEPHSLAVSCWGSHAGPKSAVRGMTRTVYAESSGATKTLLSLNDTLGEDIYGHFPHFPSKGRAHRLKILAAVTKK